MSTNDFTDGYKKKVDSMQRLYSFKGIVETINDLSIILDKSVGDVYECKEDSNSYIWNGEEWINCGMNINFSTILNKIDSLLPQTITNENGTAIKFSDGTMICNKRVTFNNIECTTTSGAIYITAQLSLGNFAEGFSDIPVMTVSKVRHDTGWVYNTNQISKTSAGYVTFATTTSRSNATFECHLIAIGRWK